MSKCFNCGKELPLFKKATLDDNSNFYRVMSFCNLDCLKHWLDRAHNKHTVAKGQVYAT